MVEGKKRTLHVPKDWVQNVQARVQAGRELVEWSPPPSVALWRCN